MLITLLTPFLGILGSLLPSLVRILEMNTKMKYDLELAKIQLQAAIQNAQIQIAIKDAEADIADAESVRSYDNNIDGGRFINALKASIRPVITYVFFFTFIMIKLIVMFTMIDQGASMMELVKTIWDQDTMALFGTIIAFWFGARILEKMGYGGMTYGRVIITNPQQTSPNDNKKTK